MKMSENLFVFHSNPFYKSEEETDTSNNGLTLALYAEITHMLKNLMKFEKEITFHQFTSPILYTHILFFSLKKNILLRCGGGQSILVVFLAFSKCIAYI